MSKKVLQEVRSPTEIVYRTQENPKKVERVEFEYESQAYAYLKLLKQGKNLAFVSLQKLIL